MTTRLGRITAAHWWRTLRQDFQSTREFIARAQKAELAEHGHECGHRFEITFRSSLHTSGPGEHNDADWWSDNDKPVVVRAHNLRDALLIAAALPLGDWFPDENEDVTR